jgi:hypothetical protein
MVVILGMVFWVLTILVPEYCLGLIRDADKLGKLEFGYLVALISILPAAILLIPATCYGLQYLGRVLVSGAMGETIPPRVPDRNVDGFLTGLSPWLVWLLLGVTVGLLPLTSYAIFLSSFLPWNPLVAFGLTMVGLPYMLMALMMAFLHDHALAATPTGVLGAMARLNGSFWPTCLVVAAAIGLSVGAFALVLLLREDHFWLYLVACLGCWSLAHWVAIVVMRILGTYYYRHRYTLRWHHERPRWGVTWGL